MNCPFCNTDLASTESAERHVLACSLAEISREGTKRELAQRCERAYASSQMTPQEANARTLRLLWRIGEGIGPDVD